MNELTCQHTSTVTVSDAGAGASAASDPEPFASAAGGWIVADDSGASALALTPSATLKMNNTDRLLNCEHRSQLKTAPSNSDHMA